MATVIVKLIALIVQTYGLFMTVDVSICCGKMPCDGGNIVLVSHVIEPLGEMAVPIPFLPLSTQFHPFLVPILPSSAFPTILASLVDTLLMYIQRLWPSCHHHHVLPSFSAATTSRTFVPLMASVH